MYFRTLKGRRIAFVMAIIMAFTIYGGLGVSPVAAVEQGGQDAVVADQVAEDDAVVADEASDDGDAVVEEEAPVIEEEVAPVAADADVVTKEAKKADATRAGPAVELEIASVEVLTSPEIQALYRDSVYKGDAEAGEDPDKWYTTETTINVRDPRIFNFEATVPADVVGADPDAFLATVKLMYGGFDLEKWATDNKGARGHLNDLRGSAYPILKLKDKAIAKNEDGSYTICVAMETECMWSAKTGSTNVPYANYGGGRQLYQFSDGQSSDNRWYWQIGPAHQGFGTYAMDLVAGENVIATRDMDINQYDGAHSWIQMNEFCQSLIAALNGEELPKDAIAEKVTGTLAKGYVAIDEDGNFVKGTKEDNVWVEVAILGYGLTDNYKEENKDFNNYAKYNPIWNVVVALDESKVDTYLNETKPTMDENPQSLIDKYSAMDAEDIDMINVFYQNNVHSDEVSGSDSEIKLIKDLIDGGKAGKKIKYKTWTNDDMTFRYRDPAEGYEQSEDGHIVTGGYEGIWAENGTRTPKKFDTREALDNLIFVNTICSNPDGKAGMRRTNRYAFDLNRDAVFTTMPETIALIKDIMKWDPIIEDEWHGYVQEMLIEPCTAPHDPAYDYDLLANNMRNLTYAAGEAITASTGYDHFLVPWDHYDGGDWDDGGTIYSPMFAELLGCYGYTIEFPDANSDSFDANNVCVYAQVDEFLHGKTDVFEGNRLNGPLEDVDGNMRDSHSVDVIDKHMKKNAILGKLMTKQRGIDNVDSMAADKYFIDKKPVYDDEGNPVTEETTDWYGNPITVQVMEDKVVGRARPVDEDGNTLSFFPDYIVIPKGELQYNIAEGIKAVNQMIDWGIKVDVTTADVEYEGDVIPKGSYVISMNQALRNVIFEVMSKGYDATGFASMYADIYCNLPDVRGFDSIQVYGKGLFDGKTKAQAEKIVKKANIAGSADAYVVFDSQSTDAVRFVNHLLAKDKDVWMLKKDVEDVGTASDYIINAKDVSEIKKVKNNPVIGHSGIELYGKYISDVPAEAAQLVEPVISFNTTRTAQSGGTLWYLLDDYLGFGSLADTEYNGSSSLRSGANVIIANNMNANAFNAGFVDAVKSGQAGVIFIRNAAGLGKLGVTAPKNAGTFQDVAINGEYNVDDSLYTAEYANTTTYYARGYYYEDLPEGSKVLFKSDENGEDAFIGGFQPENGAKDAFGDKVTMFSTTLDGDDFARPVDAVVIGQQMDYRSHYQKLLPLLATAIYASAAGIVDDADAPEIGDVTVSEDGFVQMDVPEDASNMTISIVNEDGSKTEVASGDEGTLEFKSDVKDGMVIEVTIEDAAGNVATQQLVYSEEAGKFVPLDEPIEPTGSERSSIYFHDGKYTYTYTGEPVKAFEKSDVVVTGSSGKITFKYYADEDCTEAIDPPVNAGTYFAKAFVAGDKEYKAASSLTPTKVVIKKAAQSVTKFTPASKILKAKKLKKAKATFQLKATIKGEGKVTFAKGSGNAKITISKAGKVTVKKGLKKGTYTVKVKVKIAATANYAAKTVTKTLKIKVK